MSPGIKFQPFFNYDISDVFDFVLQLVSWEEGGYNTSDKPMPRGEVVVGGGSITAGYFNNDAKTNEVYKVSFLHLLA